MPYRPTRGRDHRRERGNGWSGYPLWTGWAAPWIPNYPLFYDDGFGDDNSGQADYGSAGNPGYAQGGQYADGQYPDQSPYAGSAPYPEAYGPGGEAYGPTPYYGDASGAPYRPSSQLPEQARAPYHPSANSPAAPAPAPEVPVTLIFKDGRPPEKIHNYLLTATTLSVLDQHRQDIPVDQIDLVATAHVNHEAGVDFHVPPTARP